MHFRSMLFVDLPETKQDPQWEQEVQDQMNLLTAKHPGKTIEHTILGLYMGRLVNIQTNYGRELVNVVDKAMERFYCGTEDPQYLEFEDKTEEYEAEFAKSVDCVAVSYTHLTLPTNVNV